MIIKQVTVFLKDGNHEQIACFNYGKKTINGKEIYAFQVAADQVYTLPIELINLEFQFVEQALWSFPPGEGPFQKPYGNH